MKRFAFALVLALVAACGDSNSSTPDAPKSIDAAPSTKVVSCTGATIAATIGVNAGGTAFMPSTASVHVNDIVHFNSTASHPVASGASGTPDNKFTISTGDGCVQFLAAGTYPFFCSVHGFTGTITVQ
jgi:plastocyanin